MFGKVVRSLCRDHRGRSLVASAIGVLTGVERLFAARSLKPARVEYIPVNAIQPKPVSTRQPRFKINRTKSELGYVYWVLQECCGKPSFALFDTWQEAIDEATRRIAVTEPVLVMA